MGDISKKSGQHTLARQKNIKKYGTCLYLFLPEDYGDPGEVSLQNKTLLQSTISFLGFIWRSWIQIPPPSLFNENEFPTVFKINVPNSVPF